jgi:outer membrane protein TolC
MQRLKLLLIAVFFFPALSHAQTLQLSLEKAKQMAIDSSYATRDARYNIEKKRQEVREVLSIGLPQINGSAELQNFFVVPKQQIPTDGFPVGGGENGETPEFITAQFGTDYTMSAGITASQLIFDGTYIIGLKASKVVVQLSEYQKDKTVQEIKLSVAEAYHSVLLAEANLEILQKNLDNVNTTLEETQALYESGLTEEQDVDQLMLNRNQIQVNLDNTEAILEISKRSLNFVMGIPIETEVELTDRIEDLVQLSNNESYLNRDPQLETHPDLMLAKTNYEIANLQLKGDKAAYYPQLSAFYNYSQNAQRNEFNFFDTDQPWFPTSLLGFTLNVPIWSSFQRESKVQQSEIGLIQSELMLQQTRENLKLNVQVQRNNYQNALKVWENQKSSVDLAQRILDKTTIKYSEGIATSFELNVSQSQLLNEQTKYVRAAYDLLTAKQELDRALNIY